MEALKRRYRQNRKQRTLNLQAITLLDMEKEELQERFILSRMQKRLETNVDAKFNPDTSRKLDALSILLENG